MHALKQVNVQAKEQAQSALHDVKQQTKEQAVKLAAKNADLASQVIVWLCVFKLRVRQASTASLRVQVARFHVERALLQQQSEQAKSEVAAILASRSSQVQGVEVRAVVCR